MYEEKEPEREEGEEEEEVCTSCDEASGDEGVADGSDAEFNDHIQEHLALWKHEAPWTGLATRDAVISGHLSYVVWLHAHGAPLTEDCFLMAARWGHFRILQWLHAHGCPYDGRWAMKCGALGGSLKAVKFLHSLGCPITTFMARYAHHDRIVDWMSAHVNAEEEEEEEGEQQT